MSQGQSIMCEIQFTNDQGDYSDYQLVRTIRIVVLVISSVALIINMAIIIKSIFINSKEKQYKFNTIKLFLMVECFYLFSLVSVIPHNQNLSLGIYVKNGNNFHDLSNCIIEKKSNALSVAFQGMINMVCYSISYWFSVCITIYIKFVLDNNKKQFLTKNGMKILGICILIVVWFIIPFILTFYQNVPFSFGSVGYQFYDVYYFFYSGIVNRYQGTNDEEIGQIMVIIWILLIPIVLFVYHFYLLWMNKQKLNKLIQEDQMTPRKAFLLKSGKLCFFLFLVQMLNVAKTIAVLTLNSIQWHLIFIFNVIFDLLALVLIIIYFVYFYKQGKILQEMSLLESKSIIQSFNQYERQTTIL